MVDKLLDELLEENYDAVIDILTSGIFIFDDQILKIAILKQNYYVIKKLLDNGIVITVSDMSYAVRSESVPIVKLLIEYGGPLRKIHYLWAKAIGNTLMIDFLGNNSHN